MNLFFVRLRFFLPQLYQCINHHALFAHQYSISQFHNFTMQYSIFSYSPIKHLNVSQIPQFHAAEVTIQGEREVAGRYKGKNTVSHVGHALVMGLGDGELGSRDQFSPA